MKKLLILTAIVCSVVLSPVAHAEWTKVIKGPDETTFYVDFDRIKKNGGKIYYWELGNYLKPKRHGILSYITHHEAECGNFRLRILGWAAYTAPMGEGTAAASWAWPHDWNYVTPNSPEEAVLKVVCNHKP